MEITVEPFEAASEADWDLLVRESVNGTLKHHRAFITYHGDRFQESSFLVKGDGKLLGVFPLAWDLKDPELVVSHPGLTYGGLVRRSSLNGARLRDAFEAVAKRLSAEGAKSLLYKAIPSVYHRQPCEDDTWTLASMGASLVRSDLALAIEHASSSGPNSNRKRSLKRAHKAGVTIMRDASLFPAYWQILAEMLQERHGVTPTHSLDEIRLLQERLPKEQDLVCGVMDGEVVAGVVLWRAPTTTTSQYIASNSRGREASALDAVFDDVIRESVSRGDRFFNFGASTEDGGKTLNSSLFDFKASFGAGSFVHQFWQLSLK